MTTDPGTTAERADERKGGARSGARPPPGEWLFEREGQVFGPVPGARLIALLEEGRLDPATRIRRDGAGWSALGSVPELVPHVREARARARAAAEARRAERKARWSASARWTAWTLLLGGAVVLVAAAAAYLSVKRPWQTRSALLADFGQSIRMESARVGDAGPRESTLEIAVPDLRTAADRRPFAPTPAASDRSARGAPRGNLRADAAPREPPRIADALIATQFDPGRIEQTVARHKDRLATCVRDEARRSPEFSGAIPIQFAIGNDGRVTELWIEEPRFKSGPLRECLLAALRASSFEPFVGQRPVVSLAFHVGS